MLSFLGYDAMNYLQNLPNLKSISKILETIFFELSFLGHREIVAKFIALQLEKYMY